MLPSYTSLKLPVVVLAATLSLLSCRKDNPAPEAVPAPIVAGFGQEFKLHYQQRVELPGAACPELTVQMTDLSWTYCPQDVQCIIASFAWPTLQFTDAQGQVTQLKLPQNSSQAHALGLLDTASVVSGGRRYAVTYARWELGRALRSQEMPRRSDFGLWLRVAPVRP